MDPQTPVLPGHDLTEILFAQNQPEYNALPVLKYPTQVNGQPCGAMLSRWQPSAEDMERLLRGESIYLEVLGTAHPPVKLFVAGADEMHREISRPVNDLVREPVYTKPVCRGSIALGNACGHCERCTWELSRQACTRSGGHSGPCNGIPVPACGVNFQNFMATKPWHRCPIAGCDKVEDQNVPGPPRVPGQWYCLTHRHLQPRSS